MLATAKIFTSGNSQAIRLPKAFRINATEVWIRKNETTNEITIQPKPEKSLKARHAELMRLFEECAALPDDGFMFRPLNQPLEHSRNPFDES